MEEQKIEKEMFEKAVAFLKFRYGDNQGGVAILRIETGEYLKSVIPDALNSSVELCAETGAICEAHKLNKKVTHTLCICRQENGMQYEILSPCGVCQERLYFWGPDVKCAISTPNNDVIFKTLKELQPYYWLNKNDK